MGNSKRRAIFPSQATDKCSDCNKQNVIFVGCCLQALRPKQSSSPSPSPPHPPHPPGPPPPPGPPSPPPAPAPAGPGLTLVACDAPPQPDPARLWTFSGEDKGEPGRDSERRKTSTFELSAPFRNRGRPARTFRYNIAKTALTLPRQAWASRSNQRRQGCWTET